MYQGARLEARRREDEPEEGRLGLKRAREERGDGGGGGEGNAAVSKGTVLEGEEQVAQGAVRGVHKWTRARVT